MVEVQETRFINRVEEADKRLGALRSVAQKLNEQIEALTDLMVTIRDDALELTESFRTNHKKRSESRDLSRHDTPASTEAKEHSVRNKVGTVSERRNKTNYNVNNFSKSLQVDSSLRQGRTIAEEPTQARVTPVVTPVLQTIEPDGPGHAVTNRRIGRTYKRKRTDHTQDNRLSMTIESLNSCSPNRAADDKARPSVEKSDTVNPQTRNGTAAGFPEGIAERASVPKTDRHAKTDRPSTIEKPGRTAADDSRKSTSDKPKSLITSVHPIQPMPRQTDKVGPDVRQDTPKEPSIKSSRELPEPRDVPPNSQAEVKEEVIATKSDLRERRISQTDQAGGSRTHSNDIPETDIDNADPAEESRIDETDEEVVDAPEVVIMEDQHLEELTLKEANKAADCRDPKSQGADTILCVDTSSSMEPCLDSMKDFMHTFLNGIENAAVDFSLEENIAIVTFGKETRIIQNLTNDYAKVRDAIDGLEVGGPSPMMTGLVLCMSAIYNRGGVVTYKDRKIRPRILLLSDGKVTDQRIFNGPDSITKQGHDKKEIWRKLMEFAERLRAHGEPRQLICVPYGQNPDMELLRQLSNTAGGKISVEEDSTRLSRNFMLETVAARLVHDGGILREGLPEKSSLHETIKTAQQGYQLSPQEIEDVENMLKKELERQTEHGASGGREEGEVDGEEREMPQIGTRVRRGPDWKWRDQDSNSVGTIIAHRDRGWVSVEWDSGYKGKYRYGAEGGKKDVRVVDEPRILSDGMMAAVGCKARRGADWEWGNQDGGEGSTGIVFKIEDSGVIHVRWENGKRGNYRFGLFGKFDIEICPSSLAQNETSKGNIDEKDKRIQWQWMDSNGDWNDFPRPSSEKIENFYQKREGKGTVIVSSKNEEVRVMLEKWSQRGISSGVERPIRREVEEDL